jgi:hypothetical protein
MMITINKNRIAALILALVCQSSLAAQTDAKPNFVSDAHQYYGDDDTMNSKVVNTPVTLEQRRGVVGISIRITVGILKLVVASVKLMFRIITMLSTFVVTALLLCVIINFLSDNKLALHIQGMSKHILCNSDLSDCLIVISLVLCKFNNKIMNIGLPREEEYHVLSSNVNEYKCSF